MEITAVADGEELPTAVMNALASNAEVDSTFEYASFTLTESTETDDETEVDAEAFVMN